MRLYYVAGAGSPRRQVRSALGVDAERWNEFLWKIRDWRLGLRDRYGIPAGQELNPRDLLAVGGDTPGRGLTPQQGAEVFLGGLRLIEDFARHSGGLEVINVCLRKRDGTRYQQVALDRLLNRINASVAAANRHAFLIFGEREEGRVTRLHRRLRARNPVPSRYEAWEDGAPTRDIPIQRVIGGPAFRGARGGPSPPVGGLCRLRPPPSGRRGHVDGGRAGGGLWHPRPRPQSGGVAARPPGRRQGVRAGRDSLTRSRRSRSRSLHCPYRFRW